MVIHVRSFIPRMADTGEGHFFFMGQHVLRLFEVMKVMMTSQAQQASSSTTTPSVATPTSPECSSSHNFSSTQPVSSGTRQPLLPPYRGRAQFASGHESEDETEEEWTGTGASSDSGIRGSGLRCSLHRNLTPVSPIAVPPPASVSPPVPPPLPPRGPVDLPTPANQPEVLDMAGRGYMKIDVKTMKTYMVLPRREHSYEAKADSGSQRERNIPSLHRNLTPVSPIAVFPPVPPPLPPRGPVDLPTQANQPEVLDIAGRGYMKIDVKTMKTKSEYMILPRREHCYEVIADSGSQRERNIPSGIPLQLGSTPPIPSRGPPPVPIHRSHPSNPTHGLPPVLPDTSFHRPQNKGSRTI